MTTEKSREARCRRRLKTLGYRLEKSRIRNPHADNRGGFRLVELWNNSIAAGERFDMDLPAVERWLEEK